MQLEHIARRYENLYYGNIESGIFLNGNLSINMDSVASYSETKYCVMQERKGGKEGERE